MLRKAVTWMGILRKLLRRTARGASSKGRAPEFLAQEEVDVDALIALAAAKVGEQQFAEALRLYDEALQLEPGKVAALIGRGNVLFGLQRVGEALADYDAAIKGAPADATLLYNRGVILSALGRREDAVLAYTAALDVNPGLQGALQNVAVTLSELGRSQEASVRFVELAATNPRFPHALGNVALLHGQLADWGARADSVAAIEDGIARGDPVCLPLVAIGLIDAPAIQQKCAAIHMVERHPPIVPPLSNRTAPAHARIRLAYLSGDFHEHAISYLTAGLFEQHDRARFDVYGISFGPETAGPMRSRLKAGFDQFIDARQMDDAQIAARMCELEVDIAIDLAGYTGTSRTGVLARRPAPVQVNYLGFPGTMGAPYIDYILADRFVIPEASESHYTEKVVCLPDCFQVNDQKRPMPKDMFSRDLVGLPPEGFVFCSFNGTGKITPEIFDVWMRLLRQVHGSVLWLLAANPEAERNLRREAESRGVAANRLTFAPKRPYAEYLAQYRLADLFLDTLPFNAGTTASDALWSGLPVVTCAGNAFAARMAGSLLRAVGLPELVTHSLQDYESVALDVATNTKLSHILRQRLMQNRLNAPLFDTNRFCASVEMAYQTMHAIARNGDMPRAFSVAPQR